MRVKMKSNQSKHDNDFVYFEIILFNYESL
jgi:hypothetical protein